MIATPVQSGGSTTTTKGEDIRILRLLCPSCKHRFPQRLTAPFTVTCPACGFAIPEMNGILRAVTPENKANFERFIFGARNVAGTRFDVWNLSDDKDYLEAGAEIGNPELAVLEQDQPLVPETI